jgi:serine/threonine protein kinase
MSGDAHRRVGSWTLQKEIGRGGNATVWLATRVASEDPVALKVLHTSKATREPYQRFIREIRFLQSLNDPRGVLPVIDAHLPRKPNSRNRAWLAMPIANLITEALARSPLERVVEAINEIATTLGRLKAEFGIAHRDIKPGNLYELEGEWLVGDFGLIAVPDVEELTRSGRPLGPAHYTPYEMILDPANADPFPADVYSLGKTLWVLATGQRFPPEGHQPSGTRGFSIADFRPHPHADSLDRLVDTATRLHAHQRPTMDQLDRDLRAWRQLAQEPVGLDVSHVRARLRSKMERELLEEDLEEQRKNHAYAAVRRLQDLTAPLNQALRDVHPRAEIDAMDDRFTQNILRTPRHMGAPEVIFRWQRCSRIGSGPEHWRYTLRMGRSLELITDGRLILRAFVDVGEPNIGGRDFHWQSADRSAPAGSVEADRMLQEGVAELAEQLSEGLGAFVDHLPEESA